MRSGISILLVPALALAVAVPAFADKIQPTAAIPSGANPDPATNLLLNGSFQTGDFTDWTLGGNTGYTGVTSGFGGYTDKDSDGYFAYLGPVGSQGTLSQTFADTAGQSYTFSFYYGSFGGTPNNLDAFWNGVEVFSTSDLADLNGAWLNFTVNETGTGDDTIEFAFQNDPSYNLLDDVSVSAVPEPGSLTLLATGLLALGGALGRRQLASMI